MIIKFGLELEENIFPENMDAHVLNCGENSLLTILESFLGLGAAENWIF
jgi:hypothetical protein